MARNPNEVLKKCRRAAKKIMQTMRSDGPREDATDEELAAGFRWLDHWISDGNTLPDDWECGEEDEEDEDEEPEED